MEVHERGEILDGEGNNLTYSYMNIILRKDDSFFWARTFVRLGSPINIDTLGRCLFRSGIFGPSIPQTAPWVLRIPYRWTAT